MTNNKTVKHKDLLEFCFRHYGFDTARRRFLMPCPFHADSQSSLSVDLEKGVWKCFGCGEQGAGWRFIELMEGCDWKNARLVASDWGYGVDGKRGSHEGVQRPGWESSGNRVFGDAGYSRERGGRHGSRPGW